MKAGVIGIIFASALAAVACTNPETGPKQDRAPGSGTAAPPGGGANPNAATRDAPTVATDPGLADRTKDADNTGLNERDRRAATTTPLDQGSSAAETNITAAIRKGIMADDKLSFMGKNVKVITVGSKVTLRGPVKSQQAKVAIADIATRTAGVSDVDNQLEVKNEPVSSK